MTGDIAHFDQAVQLITDLVRQLAAHGTLHVVIDASDVAFAAPTLAERLDMVRAFALAADGRVRIAMVARADFIDAERFGVVAAGNFGLSGQVFEHEADALAWLQHERIADLQRGG